MQKQRHNFPNGQFTNDVQNGVAIARFSTTTSQQYDSFTYDADGNISEYIDESGEVAKSKPDTRGI